MEEKDIKKIEKIVGYTFKDKSLLERALTHGSASKNALENYQSLEFLGDSILDFIAAKRLMEINPNAHEGALTRIRASIVSKEPLAEEVKKLGLEKYLIVGKGENLAYISSQEKIMSDLFESMIAAIYLDSKSIDVAEKLIPIFQNLRICSTANANTSVKRITRANSTNLHRGTTFLLLTKRSSAQALLTIRLSSSR